MDSVDLQKLAEHSRFMREAGIALLFAAMLLTLFLLVPFFSHKETSSRSIMVATSTTPNAFTQISIEAKAAIVYDLVTKEVLYAKNPDAQLPLASLTKLLTVYAALSVLSPSTPITISTTATRVDAPRAFSVGQTFSLSDLARLTLTASLNDGAAAIIEATAANQNHTQSETLASVVTALELSQTYAINGSGLDVSTVVSGGYGSAYDLAILAGALAEQAPTITEATTRSSTQAVSEGGTSFNVTNTDPIVGTIPHMLLSKTGYTNLAGGNLALVFDVGMRHPIGVVILGSSKKARFTDGTTLVHATLAHFAGVSSL